MTATIIESIRSFLELGGPVVGLLMAISVIALALIGLKVFQFRRERAGDHRRARAALDLWRRGEKVTARQTSEQGRGSVDRCLSLAMRLAARPGVEKAAVEEEVSRLAITRLHDLQRGFRALDAIAQVAPLLGLFGTVLGMIEAFRQLQASGTAVDPSALAGGIWVALLTTAVGLAVAMPVSLALTWLESRVEDERVAIETLTGGIFTVAPAGDDNAGAPSPARGGLEHAH